ncbi:MAG: WD40 repeat domain-containing protein [Thermoanaerobaculia bacterium]
MKAFAAVFERELIERRLIPVIALAFGLFALLLPLIPGVARPEIPVAEMRTGAAFSFALLLSLGLALLLGASVVAGEVAEKRIGFFFARPVSGWAVWAGKMAAVTLLVLGSALLVLLPTLLTGGLDSSGLAWWSGFRIDLGTMVGLLVILVVFLQLVAHAVGMILRSRSPWVVADLLAAAVLAALFAAGRERLLRVGLGGFTTWQGTSMEVDGGSVLFGLEALLFLLTLPVLFIAGAVQVTKGRTDLRRGHRLLSLALWGPLLAVMLFFDAGTRWLVSPDPEDLLGASFAASTPGGSWIAVAGPAAYRPGAMPSFLYDVRSGRFFRGGYGTLTSFWEEPALFSADGRRAVWTEYQGRPGQSPMALYRLDLDRPGAKPQRTLITVAGRQGNLALSPDGRMLARLQDGRILLEEVDSGRLLASVPFPNEVWDRRLVFAGPGRVRLYQRSGADWNALSIFELDIAGGGLRRTGSLPPLQAPIGFALSPDGGRMIARGRHVLGLFDARTGAHLADLGDGRQASASFLPDGRVVVSRRLPAAWLLRVLSPDGVRELSRFQLDGVRQLALTDPPRTNLLRAVVGRTLQPCGRCEIRVFDLASGTSWSEGTRDFAFLGPAWERAKRFQLEGKAGVIFFDRASLQPRAVLAAR